MSPRVVIVDDSQPFLEVARTLLEREGVEIVGVASTTAAALDRVSQLRPDAVLVDIHLGSESGLELARRLHEMDGNRSTTILMSTHSEDDLATLVARAPVAGFVTKSELSAARISEIYRSAQ